MAKANANNGGVLEGQRELFGSLRGFLGGDLDEVKRAGKVVDPMREKFPVVCEILGGIAGDSKHDAVMGGTLTFFVREGKLRFSCNVKSAEKTFIGEINDVLEPWEGVEFAFRCGAVSSKRYTEHKPTLTKEQESLLL